MPPYPTPYAIEDLFNELTANRDEAVGSAMSDNVDVKVMGYDHHLASEPKGVDSLKKWIEEFATLYQDDTITFEVINVIGGGDSPWAAIEGNATAKSKTGTDQRWVLILTEWIANDSGVDRQEVRPRVL